MFETSGPVFFERQCPLETIGFKWALVFRKSGDEKRVDEGVGLFIAWLSLPSRGVFGEALARSYRAALRVPTRRPWRWGL